MHLSRQIKVLNDRLEKLATRLMQSEKDRHHASLQLQQTRDLHRVTENDLEACQRRERQAVGDIRGLQSIISQMEASHVHSNTARARAREEEDSAAIKSSAGGES